MPTGEVWRMTVPALAFFVVQFVSGTECGDTWKPAVVSSTLLFLFFRSQGFFECVINIRELDDYLHFVSPLTLLQKLVRSFLFFRPRFL